jgi:hypothetical protein
MSVWVLGSLLLGWTYRTVGLGGIVVLLATLVVVRIGSRVAWRVLHPPEDDPS